MKRFPFQNPVNQSWTDDSDTVIFGDDLVEAVEPPYDDECDTIPLGQGPLKADSPYVSESAWEEDSVDEYLSDNVLEDAEPSAPNFSRPTFEGPLAASADFARPAASVPSYFEEYAQENSLRKSSIPPAPLPPLPSRYPVPAQRAEMPTPVMEILPSLDAIRPESRPPPPPTYAAHAVSIPPAARLPDSSGTYTTASRAAAPAHLSNAKRIESLHLDTLRPVAAPTGPGTGVEAAPPAWIVTLRPWLAAAGTHLQGFREYSEEALRELLAWVAEAWETQWADVRSQNSTSSSGPRGTSRIQSVAPRPAPAPRRWPVTGPLPATSSFLNARTAAWGFGLAFAALFIAVVRSPEPAPASAAPTVPRLLDADAIQLETASDSKVEGADDKQEPEEKEESTALLEQAKAGENKALAKLSSREPTSLSLEEVQALAVGEEKIAREKTTAAVMKIAEKKRISSGDRAQFLRHVGNPRTYREALMAMAENRSWQGPDLIYLAMRHYRSQKHVVDFALSLLLTPRIYKYASPALTVVIDAESMSAEPTSTVECFHIRQLVDRAFEDGDNRAVRHMARFASTTGCGDNGNEDCYPCLRDDSALVDALGTAKSRRPPF